MSHIPIAMVEIEVGTVLCEVRAGADETVFIIEKAYYVRGSVRDEVE
jgi:hypothetical protein